MGKYTRDSASELIASHGGAYLSITTDERNELVTA